MVSGGQLTKPSTAKGPGFIKCFVAAVFFIAISVLVLMSRLEHSRDMSLFLKHAIAKQVTNILSDNETDVMKSLFSDLFSPVKESLPEDDYHIFSDHEELWLGYTQTGWTFDEKGRKTQIYEDVITSRVHSFSPYVEKETRKRFIDPDDGNRFYANSPAVIFDKGRIILVSRIWLARESIKYRKKKPVNTFADNYFYKQIFDRWMKPISEGEIMGIPAPKQFWIGDGPIEPRLFRFRGRIYISFNNGMSYTFRKTGDPTLFWDLQKNLPIFPKIKGGSPMEFNNSGMFRDKHWMAFEMNNTLYMVYTFDPLRVLKCTIEGDCEFVPQGYPKNIQMSNHVAHLRGGSTFEQYEGDYFISIAHTTMFVLKGGGGRYYSAHLVVMDMKNFRIVYVSDDIQLDSKIYWQAPMVRGFRDGFLFPVSLIIEDKDSIIIGGHVNDFSSILVRMKGVQKLMRKIIDDDIEKKPKSGPPLRYIDNHTHWMMQKITTKTFSNTWK